MANRASLTSDECLMFECPGCGTAHSVPIRGEITWTFNGDLSLPTLSPSILIYGSPVHQRCHSFIRDGKIMFLVDCSHSLAGQTVDLPDWT